MSTEQEDVVLLLQLEEKVTRRIRSQIRLMATMHHSPSAAVTDQIADDLLDPAAIYGTLVANIRTSLLNDPTFISEMTRRVGQRISQVY
jgi:hypothetical protein